MGSMRGPRYNRYRGLTIRAITGFYCIAYQNITAVSREAERGGREHSWMGYGQHMLIGFLYNVGNSLKLWKQQSQHTRPIVHARTLNIGAIQRHYSIV